MRSFLSEFKDQPDRPRNIIFVEQDSFEAPRQYSVVPRELWKLFGAIVAGSIVLTALLLVATPLKKLIPGYGTDEIRQNARMNAIRLEMLEDSLAVQNDYIARLRFLITGELGVDSSSFVSPLEVDHEDSEGEPYIRPMQSRLPEQDEQQQLDQLVVNASFDTEPMEDYASTVSFPTLPPVDGFLTRGYDATSGHFGTDIAVPEGTPVRSIGDGYVIFSDWTQEGGHALAIQHGQGYISVYKHNLRLTKRIGERVRSREIIAISGNSGEVTTGPHLHFEIWRNGLAQDARSYIVSW